MFIITAKVRKGRIAAVAAAAAVVCGVLVAAAGLLGGRGAAASAAVSPKGVRTNEDRIAYLESYGWSVSSDPIAVEELIIPEQFDETYSQYLELQASQGFDLTDGGEIYYSQISSDGTSVIVCRAAGPGQDARAEYMTLKYFGHGTQIVAEEASDGKTYIWLNSNASVDSSGEYGDNWSVSRVEFVPGALSEAGYAGETFFLNKDGQYDQQVAIDFPARRLLVGSRKSGVRYFWIFDLDEALALPLKTMTATVTVGSAGSDPVTREIRARDLNDCRVLGSFSVPAGSDKENDVYSYSHQGHEVAGNYVYFYEGNAVETGADSFASKAYVTVFNYSGKIVVPRTEVAAVADKAGLAAAGLTTTGYAEGESLKVRDGKLYLGVACRDGSSSNRRANILVYDCVQAE